jgi:hypothetical protein
MVYSTCRLVVTDVSKLVSRGCHCHIHVNRWHDWRAIRGRTLKGVMEENEETYMWRNSLRELGNESGSDVRINYASAYAVIQVRSLIWMTGDINTTKVVISYHIISYHIISFIYLP